MMAGIIYRRIKILLTGLGLLAMLTACNDNISDLTPGYADGEILVAHIDGGASGNTRVAISSVDEWSHTKFDSPDDVIGFYSLYGNLEDKSGNGPFVNEPMVYARGEAGNRPDDNYWKGVFRPVQMNYDVGLIQNEGDSTFIYFPYTDKMEKEGMELRRQMEDGSYRCIDALAAARVTNSNGETTMSATFNHTFSEIVIIRGYGFDNPRPGQEEIKVVTTQPYSHAKVVPNTNKGHSDWKILKPVYDKNYTTLSEQECREWVAWDASPYFDGDKELPVKYVIIPTAISGDRSTVNYVELYDNNGTLHKVTTFGLMTEDDKRVSPNERYWLTIKLEGLVPTIYPFAITPWAEETRYIEQRAKGINTPQEFMQFVMAYNSYNQNQRDVNLEDGLKTFGDRYDTDGDIRWHFHINNDIDLSSLNVDNITINNLCDTIDGRTKTLYGFKSNKAMISELQSKGCVRNLNITGLNITNNTGNFTGGLINIMTGGLVTGCNIDGYLNSASSAGMAVGQFNAGTISGSSFSGLVVGTSSYNKIGLIGIEPSGGILPDMLKNVNTSSLVFMPIEN